MKIDNADPVLYLIMRNDMPSMNPGKLAAQAAHLSTSFTFKMLDRVHGNSRLFQLFTKWTKSTKQNFGTKICLGASYKQIMALNFKDVVGTDYVADTINDPEYPEIISLEVAHDLIKKKNKNVIIAGTKGIYLRDETVGCYLFCDRNSDIRNMVNHLKLYD
jgi:peptidyl-tRNA hydrolase